jgi:hypothetical protein
LDGSPVLDEAEALWERIRVLEQTVRELRASRRILMALLEAEINEKQAVLEKLSRLTHSPH